jgi:hypothetical protein
MNQKRLNAFGWTALCLAAAAAFTFGVPPRAILAQSTNLFTMVSAGGSNGVVIVDQSTGGITFCTSLACELLGRATLGSGSASLSVVGSGNSVFILNSQTGQVVACTAIGNPTATGTSSLGRSGGSCESLGNANR